MTYLEAHRAKSTSQLLFTVHECQPCGTRTDVSRYQPGQKLICPGCGTDFFVQGLEAGSATPVPRVVSGPVAKRAQQRPWKKIAVTAGVVIALTAGILYYRRVQDRNEISSLPPDPIPAEIEQAASSAGSALPKVVASQSGVMPGIYVLKNVQSEKALEVYKYGTGLDARLYTEPASGAGNQRWILRPMGPDVWQIVSFHSLKALEIEGGSSDDGARIAQGKLTGNTPQLWRIERSSGAFRFVAQGSGKALTQVDDLERKAHVGQREKSDSARQLWKLESPAPLPREANLLFATTPMKAPATVSAAPGAAPIDGRFVAVSLSESANSDSREGMFQDPKAATEAVHPLITGWVRAGELPFQLLPTSGKNAVLMLGGQFEAAKRYPGKVEIPMGDVRLTKLHFLGGVAAWGYPWASSGDDRFGCVMVKVILVRKGGVEEPILLRNGVEFADYNGTDEVPGSARVTGLVAHGHQVRTFSKTLASNEPVEKIILQGYAGHATPVFLAMTGEVAK